MTTNQALNIAGAPIFKRHRRFLGWFKCEVVGMQMNANYESDLEVVLNSDPVVRRAILDGLKRWREEVEAAENAMNGICSGVDSGFD